MTAVDRPVRIEIIDPLLDDGPGAVGADRAAVVAVVDEAADVDPLRWVAPVAARLGRLAWSGHGRMAQWRLNGNPRRRSTVRRHLAATFTDTGVALSGATGPVVVASGRLELTSPFAPVDGLGLRARGRLQPRWSWPPLPVEVTVEPWWRDRCVLTMQLRTRRRWRYPRRYFDVAHGVLGRLVTDRPVDATPPAGPDRRSSRSARA